MKVSKIEAAKENRVKFKKARIDTTNPSIPILRTLIVIGGPIVVVCSIMDLHWLDRKVRLMNFEPVVVATGLKRVKLEEDKTLLAYVAMAETYLQQQQTPVPVPGFLTYMRVAAVLTGRRDCMERWVYSEVRMVMRRLGIVDYRQYDTNDLCADNLELVEKMMARHRPLPPKLEIDTEGKGWLPPEAVTIWCSTLGLCRRVGSRFMFEQRHLPYAWISALETGLFAEQRMLETVVSSLSFVVHPLLMQILMPPPPKLLKVPRGTHTLAEIRASPNLTQCQRQLIETYDQIGEFKRTPNHDTRFIMVTFLVHAGVYTEELEGWLATHYKVASSQSKSFTGEIENAHKFHPHSCATLQKGGLCPFNDMIKCKQAVPSSPVELRQWTPIRVFQTPLPPPVLPNHVPKVEVQIDED